MNRKPEVPEPTKSEIDSLRDKARAAFKAGEDDKGLDLMAEAWAAIPEPKSKWDYYGQSMSITFLQLYVRRGDVEQTRHWISVAYEMYDDPQHENHYVLMFEGSSLYSLGLKDESYGVFERIFDLFGRDGFKGEHLKYLEFYLKERAQRDE